MIKTSTYLILLIISFSVNADWDTLFKSCDTQWKEAWLKCNADLELSCAFIKKDFQPNCEPDDKHLKTFEHGYLGYAMNEFHRKYIKNINITDLRIINLSDPLQINQASNFIGCPTGKYCWGLNATIENKNKEITLFNVFFNCKITFDDAYIAFNSTVYAEPNLLPIRSRKINLTKQITRLIFTTDDNYSSATYTCIPYSYNQNDVADVLARKIHIVR